MDEQLNPLMDSEKNGYRNEKPHIKVQAVICVRFPFTFPQRFAELFHGETELKRGRYYVKYLNEDVARSRLVNEFTRRYNAYLTTQFQFAGSVVY